MVTPDGTRAFEQQVGYLYKSQVGAHFAGPVAVRIECYFSPARSLSQKARHALIGKAYDHKPDADNICKAVLDALNGVAYDDDRQVYGIACLKRYAAEDAIVLTLEGDEG